MPLIRKMMCLMQLYLLLINQETDFIAIFHLYIHTKVLNFCKMIPTFFKQYNLLTKIFSSEQLTRLNSLKSQSISSSYQA